MNKLFNEQMMRLRILKCPNHIIRAFFAQKEKLIKELGKMTFGAENIPFLLVIPFEYLPLSEQLRMLRLRGVLGFSNLDPEKITDPLELSCKSPYFILDVEDGKNKLNRAPDVAYVVIRQEERMGLTLPETIALCVQKDVLCEHSVFAIESRYEKKLVPGLGLEKNQPILTSFEITKKDPNWGSPSCACRVRYQKT